MHRDTLHWVCPPKYLVLYINRFVFSGIGLRKSHCNVPVQSVIDLNNILYHLVGTIEHHGHSITSGHYTCTLFHNDNIFKCNDMVITEYSEYPGRPSSTVYIMIYKLNE